MKQSTKKLMSLAIAFLLLFQMLPLGISAASPEAVADGEISNASISAKIGDLGQIEELYINNNPLNRNGDPINFVLPNDTAPQNDVQHQWMGEMIFSYRTGDSDQFPDNRDGFVEVDTNKTLAAGGSTTYSNINPDNPYIEKATSSDGKKVEVNFIGHDLDSSVERAMKGFDVKSVFDTDTDDGSLLWEITVKNKSDKFIEFGDIGLPMPWNNKYRTVSDTYDNRLTVHNFAGADSGYSYAIRTSGEGNFMMFTPVTQSGARIEYVDYWMAEQGELRAGNTFANWQGDQGGWFPGLHVVYIHSKDIQKTGRGYFTDATSLVLGPEEEKTYQFKFSAVRAGDNDPQESADSPNNASTSVEEREANLRSILYRSGMIDAVAVPGFQTAINMPVKLDLHYDDSIIDVQSVEILSVYENDPFDEAHIPDIRPGRDREDMVNNSRGGRGLPDGNPGYTRSVEFEETKIVNGEQHHIYSLQFDTLGNNSVRVEYKLKVGDEWVDKFTQYEFNVLAELDETVRAHSEFMVEYTQDKDPESPTYGNYRDWYLTTGLDEDISHWGDDWSHDNIDFMVMKNYLDPNPEEIRSIELFLIDFMWERFMKNTQHSYRVANWLKDSGSFTENASPYNRTFSEILVAHGYFNMYRIQKAYPNLMEYRETPQYHLEKAYGIYFNRVSAGTIGFYGEQQIPDMIEALKEEGMLTEYENLKTKFAYTKGRAMTNARYPYGSEFEYDNTGEEGAYAAAKALRTYYPDDPQAEAALEKMEMTDWKTRAMRGLQPTWYHYSVPVFRGGEGWWNFQYTASLAGYIMDDWLRYQDDGRTQDQRAIAQQRNYAGKISNFNAINMGQISADSIGSTSWRYSMYKGGTGTKNVFDGGLRVMNNGWNDFSGEAELGIYGSLLLISSDIVTDPVFGLFGYGALVTDEGDSYSIIPKDGFGRRINLIDEKIYLVSENDKIESAEIQKDGKAFTLQLSNPTGKEHASKIAIDGAGVEDGYYSIKLNDEDAGQFYVNNNKGVAMFQMNSAPTAEVTIEKVETGENQAPQVNVEVATQAPQALIPFTLHGIVTDDGAPNGTLTYEWEVVSTPDGGELNLTNPNATITRATGTKEGSYTVELTANDGELSTTVQFTFELAAPPEKQAPEIVELTAIQDETNSSIVVLSGEATPDPLYAESDTELTYEWTVKEKPEDAGNITIVNEDKATAYARVSKAGTYVFTFTVEDEGKVASEDVTFVIEEDLEDVYQAINVVTQKDVAPTLPEQMDVLFEDGYSLSEIEWDEIDPDSYATLGEFEVSGKVVNTDIDVRVTVYVVDVKLQNAAPFATPSASYSARDGYPEAMNNGYDPTSSRDFSPNRTAPNNAWHNWGREFDPSWVMYEWDQAILASSMDVYVFEDNAGNFRPKDMQLQLRDAEGNWYTPRGINGLGNEINKYNTTTFEPAFITGVRIDMKPVANGTGILQWKVHGYTGAVDKIELSQLYNFADGLNAANLIGDGLAPIEEAKTNAYNVIRDMSATEEDVEQAIERLMVGLSLLKPRDNNMAFVANVSASFTSSWESLPAVNDGRKDSSRVPHWGTWGNSGAEEWVQYDWPMGATIESSNLMLWTDGGGIAPPTKYTYSYIPLNSDTNEWVTLDEITEGITALQTPVGSDNIYVFDPTLEVKSLRVTLTKRSSSSQVGVGLWEWEVFHPGSDQEEPADPELEEVTGVKVTAGDGQLTITWVNPSYEDFDHVRVTGTGIVPQNIGEGANSTTITGLVNGATYTITLQTVDKSGNISEGIDVSGTPVASGVEPTDPESPVWVNGVLAAENVTDTQITLKWSGVQSDLEITEFMIIKDSAVLESVTGSVYQYVVTGLSPATEYHFKVEAGNEAGKWSADGPSLVVKTAAYEDLEAPSWPENSKLEYSNLTQTQLTLTWTSAEDNIGVDKYKIIWSNGEKEVNGNTTTVDITGLQSGTTYTFTVESGDAAGNWSTDGPSVTVTTLQSGGGIYYPPVVDNEPALPEEEEEEDSNLPTDDSDTPTEEETVTFSDIEGHWAGEAIHRAVTLKIVNGYPNGTFQPNRASTRAEFVVMLSNALQWEGDGSSAEFSDDQQIGSWAKQAIAQAVQLGVVTGYGDGSFRPDQQISRAEMAVMIARALGLSTDAANTNFEDNEVIPHWARGAVEALRELGIIEGRGKNLFAPNEIATRAEVVTIILRILDM